MGKKFQSQVAAVTGGARGLGRLIALDLARRGADVAIADLRETDLQKTSREIEALGVKALPLALDLSRKSDCLRMVSETREHLGRVDILVNNAGIVDCRNLVEQADEMIEKTVEVNFWAQVWATRAVLPELISRKKGIIVSVSSGAALVGVPALSAYCATKSALAGFFNSLRHELRKARTGIRVIVIYPGFMDTKMFKGAKLPRFTRLIDPRAVSAALMRAIDRGQEEVFVPRAMLKSLSFLRGILPPRLLERSVELSGLDESFYSSKTID